MPQNKDKVATDGAYADGDLVQVPLVNLELGPNYRSQLRDMDSLVESVYRFGVLTTLWVEPHATVRNKYVIFSGRRRYEAARQAAQRRARESSSDEALAVQVGRYTVPCRIFRNLRKAQQAVLSLMENLVRSNPSAQDTAREMGRARRLIEEEFGQKVSVEDLMTLFEGAARPGGKAFHRRHVYKLLRIGDMDGKVLEAARNQSLAMDYLVAIGRLSSVEVQLALIECIQKQSLTRQEVRLVVNEILASDSHQTDLSALIAELRRSSGHPVGTLTSDPTQNSGGPQGGGSGRSGVYATGHSHDAGAVPGAGVTREHVGEPPSSGVAGDGDSRPLGKEKVFRQEKGSAVEPAEASGEQGEGKPSVADLPAEVKEGASDTRARQEWLEEVEARFGQEEAARIKKALGKVPYTAQDKRMMRAMHMYKGILPEHLPSYLEMVKETMAESPWFGRVVACSFELLDLLAQREEHQKLRLVPGRFFDILLSEFYWAAAPYDQNLAYYLDRISRFRKEELAGQVEAKG